MDERDESVTHNLNLPLFANLPFGTTFSTNDEKTGELTSPEPAPIPIKCNVHPWERGYLFVLEHAYVGVSDAQGNIAIRGLPDDTDVPLRLFHEPGSIQSIVLQGARRQIERGRQSLRIQ